MAKVQIVQMKGDDGTNQYPKTRAKAVEMGAGKGTLEDKLRELESIAGKVPVVDDLTTGGRDKALSAEQGKKLNDRIEGVPSSEPQTIRPQLELVSGFINANGWSESSGLYSYSQPIHVKEGGKVTLSYSGSMFAPLSSSSKPTLSFPLKVIYEDKDERPREPKTYIYNVKEDCYLVFCGRTDPGFSLSVEILYEPKKIDGLKQEIDKNTNDIANLTEEVQKSMPRDIEVKQSYATPFTEGVLGTMLSEKIETNIMGKYIEPDGRVGNSDIFSITSPILLHTGESVEVTTRATKFCVIANTDISSSFYKPIKVKDNSQEIYTTYKYVAKEDCYVACCVRTEGSNITKVSFIGGSSSSSSDMVVSGDITLQPKEGVLVTTAIQTGVIIAQVKGSGIIPLVSESGNPDSDIKEYSYYNTSESAMVVRVSAPKKFFELYRIILTRDASIYVSYLANGFTSSMFVDNKYSNIRIFDNGTFDYLANASSVVIPVKEGCNYHISRSFQTERFRLGTSKVYPIANTSPQPLLRYIDDGKVIVDNITIEKGEHFLIVYLSPNAKEPKLSVTITKGEIGGSALPQPLGYNVVDFDYYVHADNLEDLSTSLASSKHTIVYDIYDKIKADFPTYLTIKEIGKTVRGQSIKAVEISTPKKIGNDSRYISPRPQIFILANIHGYEQMAGYATAKFIEDLFRNPTPINNYIREFADFYIIPVANPDGYDDNSRYNANKVDLNHNFTVGWKSEGMPYPSGTGPASEPESKAIIAYSETIRHYDYYYDVHNIGDGTALDPVMYLYNDKYAAMAQPFYAKLSAKWIKEYDLKGDKVRIYGRLTHNNPGATSVAQMLKEDTIGGVIFETPWRTPFAPRKYDKITLETSVELIGNMILWTIKDFNRIKNL